MSVHVFFTQYSVHSLRLGPFRNGEGGQGCLPTSPCHGNATGQSYNITQGTYIFPSSMKTKCLAFLLLYRNVDGCFSCYFKIALGGSDV